MAEKNRIVELKRQIVELNVGGVNYTTTIETLTKDPQSLFYEMLQMDASLVSIPFDSIPIFLGFPMDSKGRLFIDRDGVLFRFILDFLRTDVLVLPSNFLETERLHLEATYFKLFTMAELLLPKEPEKSKDSRLSVPWTSLIRKRPSATDMSGASGGEGYIVVGYRGTFTFGKDMSDVKFRKLTRILVHGKVMLCREVFQDTLNDSRDPDRGMDQDRYTARYYLKHTNLEQAFDQLSVAGFRMVGSAGTGTSSLTAQQDLKPGQLSEESQWNHYNEFVFVREDQNPNAYSISVPSSDVDA